MEINNIGTANDKPVKIANGAASNAGLNDLSLLKNFVVIIKTIKGKNVLTTA